MAFAPPPGQDEIQFGYTDLYGLNIADSTAQPWLIREDKRESLFSPTWSPDGRFVYFARLDRRPILGSNPEQFDIGYNVERAAYPDGQPEVVVADAFFPRLSADGQRLVYVAVDPQTFANALYVSDTNGGNAVRLFGPEQFIAVDSPLFTPDGQYVLFSAVSDGTASAPAVQSLFDWLTGVQAAEAHNVPSDWWRIPVTGGQAEKITNLLEIGLYGAFSPDGRYMAFITSNGLMLMNPDGSGVRKLAPLTNAFGTLEWMR
jgi:Tol biopolymer transport system component